MKISAVLKKSALQAWTPELTEGGGLAFEFTAGQVYDGGEGTAVVTDNSIVTTTGFAVAQGAVTGLSTATGKVGIYYKLTNIDIESMPNDSDLASNSGFIPAGFNLATPEFPDFGVCAVVGLNKGPMGVVTKTLLEISDPFGSTFTNSIDEEITVDSDTEFCLAFDKDAGTYGTVYFYTSEVPNTPWSYEFVEAHPTIANFLAYPNGTNGASIGIEQIASPALEHTGVTNASAGGSAFNPASIPENCAGKLYQIAGLAAPILIAGNLYSNTNVVWFDLDNNFRGLAFLDDYLTEAQANELYLQKSKEDEFDDKYQAQESGKGLYPADGVVFTTAKDAALVRASTWVIVDSDATATVAVVKGTKYKVIGSGVTDFTTPALTVDADFLIDATQNQLCTLTSPATTIFYNGAFSSILSLTVRGVYSVVLNYFASYWLPAVNVENAVVLPYIDAISNNAPMSFASLLSSYSSSTYDGKKAKVNDVGIGAYSTWIKGDEWKPQNGKLVVMQNSNAYIKPCTITISAGSSGHAVLTTALNNTFTSVLGGAWVYINSPSTVPALTAGFYYCEFTTSTTFTVFTAGVGSAAYNFTTGATVTGDTSEITMVGFAIPASLLGKNGALTAYGNVEFTGSTNAKTTRSRLNTAQVTNQGVANSGVTYLPALAYLRNRNSENINIGSRFFHGALGTGGGAYMTTENTAIASTYSVTFQTASELDNMVLNGITMELSK